MDAVSSRTGLREYHNPWQGPSDNHPRSSGQFDLSAFVSCWQAAIFQALIGPKPATKRIVTLMAAVLPIEEAIATTKGIRTRWHWLHKISHNCPMLISTDFEITARLYTVQVHQVSSGEVWAKVSHAKQPEGRMKMSSLSRTNALKKSARIIKFGRPQVHPCDRCHSSGIECIVMPGELKCAECTRRARPCVKTSWAALDHARDKLSDDIAADEKQREHLIAELSNTQTRLEQKRRARAEADRQAEEKMQQLLCQMEPSRDPEIAEETAFMASGELKCAECTRRARPCVKTSWAALDHARDKLSDDIAADEKQREHLIAELSNTQTRLEQKRRARAEADRQAEEKMQQLLCQMEPSRDPEIAEETAFTDSATMLMEAEPPFSWHQSNGSAIEAAADSGDSKSSKLKCF
nr:hypothetical protein CFP56_20242 [Quercus suber]